MSDPVLNETGTEVAILGAVTAVAVFGTKGGVDAILERIRSHARSVETDISTVAGRQAVASLAYKIARSKTALDGMGKELGETNYRAWKAITAERSRIETELDALRDEVRAPLTAWENAEKARIAAHKDAIDAFVEGPQFYAADNSSRDLAVRLRYLENLPLRDWQEFAKRAGDALKGEIEKTSVALTEAIRREAAEDAAAKAAAEESAAKAAREEERHRQAVLAAAALARQEAEQQAKAAAEAEARRVDAERIAAEEKAAAAARVAEERARREREEIEAKARREREAAEIAANIETRARERAEREKVEAEARAARAEEERIAAERRAKEQAAAAAARAEQERLAAAERAEQARRQAIDDERRRAEGERKREADEAARREADRQHRGAIHSAARAALVAGGLSDGAATTAITLIAGRKVPGVSISY